MNKATLAMSDDDFMAELLGVKPKDIVERTVNVDAQLHSQLSSIYNQRAVTQDFRGVENSEHIRSPLESNSRG